MAAMAVLCLVFVGCSDDDEPSYSQGVVTNTELKDILAQKGYQFNEEGNLLLDDKANQTTTLDLSGTNISVDALSELSILPNLTDVDLSNNGYTDRFDFSKLPAQITGVDLTDNEIYDYDNLVKVEVAENGDETITPLHNITKLYLPAEAKDNIKQLMRFYRHNKTAIDDGTMDVKMVNASGTLEKYTTLRSIPDETLRAYLNEKYSSIFVGEQIDLCKRLNNSEKINEFALNSILLEMDKVSNLDGIQYIVNNPYWEGTTVSVSASSKLPLPKLTLGEYVSIVILSNVSAANGLDISDATSLYYITLTDVDGVESIDLSTSNVWGQRDVDTEELQAFGSRVGALGCPDLKAIYFPEATPLRALSVDLECLDNLETCDLSKFSFIQNLSIGDIPASFELKYPDITEFSSMGRIYFACSKSTYELESTTEFINKYKSYNGEKKINRANLTYSGNTTQFWR